VRGGAALPRVTWPAGHVTRPSRRTSGNRTLLQCERDRRARCTSIVEWCRCFSRQRSSPVRDVLSVRATSAPSPIRHNNDARSVLSSEPPLLFSSIVVDLTSPRTTCQTTRRTDAGERQLGGHFFLSSLFRRGRIREVRVLSNAPEFKLWMFKNVWEEKELSIPTRDPGITRDSHALC